MSQAGIDCASRPALFLVLNTRCDRMLSFRPLASLGLRLATCSAALLAGCVHAPVRPVSLAPQSVTRHQDPFAYLEAAKHEETRFPLEWYPGEVLLQGYLGAKYFSDFVVDRDPMPPIELGDDEVEVLPVVGGGAQVKLAGEGFDFGLEGLLSFSGRSNLEAFSTGSGGVVAVFDVDLLIFETYGGLFLSTFLGDKVRLYGSSGPLLQWVGYDQSGDNTEEDSQGFGFGYYARTGLEFLLPSRHLLGFGLRWSESEIDLGDGLGDLDLQELELFFSYSYGFPPPSPYGF